MPWLPVRPGELGRACALALAEAGADIALGLRDIDADNGLVKEIEAMGRKALPLQMDVSKMEEINAAFEKIKEYYGRVDIVINNAGIAPENLAENVTEKDFDYTLDGKPERNFFCKPGSRKNDDTASMEESSILVRKLALLRFPANRCIA